MDDFSYTGNIIRKEEFDVKKRHLIVLAVMLVMLCFVWIAVHGRTCTVTCDLPYQEEGNYEIEIEQDEEVVRLVDAHDDGSVLTMTFEAAGRGKAFASVSFPDGMGTLFPLYVHRLGIITYNGYFGDCSGSLIIPVCVTVYLAALFIFILSRYRKAVRGNMYRYRNILMLSLMIFLVFLIYIQIRGMVGYDGIVQTVRQTFFSAGRFAILALPAAFVLSILVTFSNIDLMRKEGRNWHNMLGCMLGLLLCFSTVFPMLLGEWLQRTTIVDVHNENGIALYVELFAENAVFFMVVYLECMLIGTIFFAWKAAKRIPAFDKDYILILGCMIRRDGTLTPLLKGRADRAVEFAAMQKQASGKDLVFVPSGGQGKDEVIAEGDAIRNYLLGIGIPEEQILTENRSANTYENFGCSMKLIREHSADADPKIAFSTTNYHVFRSGMYAEKQGIYAEGIGSATKRYFWVNAFVREYIAMLSAEKKIHIRIVLSIFILVLFAVAFLWFANNL